MNLRTGLKTMAVALPMAVAPMKSTAQNVVKETAKAPLEYKARLGLGYGRTAYFDQMHYEPKIIAEIGSRNDKAVAEFDAMVGKSNQEFKAFVGMPVAKGKAGYVDFGGVARYQHNGSSATEGVILNCEVNSASEEFANEVSLNRTKGFIGAYVAPTLKVGDVNITPHAEGGWGFLADFGSTASVPRSEIGKVIDDGRMVDRSNAKMSANLGLSVDANLDSGIRAGLDVNHSTFDHSTSVMAKITYAFENLFKKH